MPKPESTAPAYLKELRQRLKREKAAKAKQDRKEERARKAAKWFARLPE
jgi:hypothetical protein